MIEFIFNQEPCFGDIELNEHKIGDSKIKTKNSLFMVVQFSFYKVQNMQSMSMQKIGKPKPTRRETSKFKLKKLGDTLI